MKYKLIAFDIDGTLTNKDKIISAKTKEAIMNAQKQGVIVALASGRPTPGMVDYANELELEKFGGYILSYNGGQIYSCKEKKQIAQESLPNDILPKLYDFAKENKVDIISYRDDEIITETDDNKYIQLESRLSKLKITLVDSFVETIDFPVPKCLMIEEGHIIKGIEPRIKELYGDKLNIFRSEDFFLEFMPQGVDKGTSLKKLIGILGIKQEELIACGDSYNDLAMIEFAGLGVAMENGKQAIKDAANYIAGHNNEDGLVPMIEKFILNN